VTAREEILARVRDALAAAPAGVAPTAEPDGPGLRAYRTCTEDGLDIFLERLRHYGAHTRRVADRKLRRTVRATLADRGVRRVVAPEGIPEPWLGKVERLTDTPALDARALDEADAVITTCALAIAATGTIVLDGSAGMGRRALSLVPDYHLCVVRSGQIVSSVPEAIARLDATRPLTFISGPSATVDIEMVRVSGVHGPRRLEVIVGE